MHEFLTVCWISLVGVIAYQLILVEHQIRFPYGREAVVGNGFAAFSDVRDKFPGYPAVSGCIEFDVRGAQIGWDSGTREEYRSCFPLGEVAGEKVEEGLVTVSVSVLGVVHPSDLAP